MLVCLFGFYCWYFCTFVRIVVLPYFSLSTCKRLYLFCRKITVSKNWPEPTKTTTKKRLAWAIDRTTENHVPEIKTDLDCLFFICWLICLFVLFVSERSSAESLRCTHYLWKKVWCAIVSRHLLILLYVYPWCYLPFWLYCILRCRKQLQQQKRHIHVLCCGVRIAGTGDN